MDNDLIILNICLHELGVPPAIDTINDRKRVQKAIYLAQAAGVNFGYDYNWYVHGPYSPELANDYYKLAEALLVKDIPVSGDGNNGLQIEGSVRNKLKSLASIINKPPGFPLEQEDWLELASSLHFLRTVSKQDAARARQT
jgi:uncharacterized protein YwgA